MIHQHTHTPPAGYDPQTGVLYCRRNWFTLDDGWRLMAESIEDAEREAEEMGETELEVEVDH